jgi:O-methyltransferase involved in polyketide biosynthesis
MKEKKKKRKEEKCSRTAYRVALRRASHQLLDDPKVFDDPLAWRVLGPKTIPNCNRIPA